MKTNPITKYAPAGMALALLAAPALGFAQDDAGAPDATGGFRKELAETLKQRMERYSRLFENDPKSKEQFEQGLEEMLRAIEEGKAAPGEPQRFEFKWEGDASNIPDFGDFLPDIGDLFDDLGGGHDQFKRGFDPFGNDGFFGGDFFDSLRGMMEGAGGFSFPPLSLEPREIPELSKNHPDELRKFRSVVAKARQSTVRILSGGNQIALGTIITEDGYILTKQSELERRGGEFEVELATGRTVPARIVEKIADFDLAFVKLAATGLTPAEFVEENLPVGSFLAASGTGEDPVAIGVLSVLPRNLSDKRKGFLGIAVDTADKGVRIVGVGRESAAADAGLTPGDVITAVGGRPISSPAQLIKAVSSTDPNASVEIAYLRDGNAATANAKLGSRAELPESFRRGRAFLDLTQQMGADLNWQRDGYPSALQHDLPLSANQIGGPLADLDGHIIGINIARAGRVSTFALPAKDINAIIAGLKLDDRPAQDNALSPSAFDDQRPAVREELDSAERAVKEARDALRAAEDRAKAARNRLKK